MANASIGGLVSGLDTATIISQLMQLEALPQTKLRARVSQDQKAVNALQTLNAKLASIATKAAELAKAGVWSPTKTSSTSAAVTVTAAAGATPTSLTFTVGAVATAAQQSYTKTGTLGESVMPSDLTYRIVHDDPAKQPFVFETGDGTLEGLAKAINVPASGLRATLVRSGFAPDGVTPTYQMQLSSTTTGASSGFDVSQVDPLNLPLPPASPLAWLDGVSTDTAGSDASITIAGQASPITSTSNTFKGLMPGVDVTLGASATGPVTVSIERDAQSLTDKVKAMVDTVNLALTEIGSLTAYNADTKTAGLLAGDSTLRSVRNQVLDLVTDGIDGTSLATVGIQVDRAGKLTFDATKFSSAYAADPVGTAAKFTGAASWTGDGTVDLSSASWRTVPGSYAVVATATGATIGGTAATVSGSLLSGAAGSPVEGLVLRTSGDVNGTVTYSQGFAAKLEALTMRLSEATEGTVSKAIKNRASSIKGMEDDIAKWDTRLTSRRAGLERQYAALETALGKLQSQSSWLAGQINSLPSWNNQ